MVWSFAGTILEKCYKLNVNWLIRQMGNKFIILLLNLELLWTIDRPGAFLVYQGIPTKTHKCSNILKREKNIYVKILKGSNRMCLLTMQALVSFFSLSFRTTAKASWMLASMNSSEDPLKYLGIWENYVQCIQISMSHKGQVTMN